MSPLARLVLIAIRVGARAAAVFVAAALAIDLWKHWAFGGFGAMGRGDFVFLGVLAAILAGALWLVRAVGRELANSGP